GIQNRERPDRKAIGPAQRNASIKPQATLFQPWVVGKARVSRQVTDDQHLIIGNHVAAKGDVARSAAGLSKVGWQTGLRFEPLSIFVNQSKKGNRDSEEPG